MLEIKAPDAAISKLKNKFTNSRKTEIMDNATDILSIHLNNFASLYIIMIINQLS